MDRLATAGYPCFGKSELEAVMKLLLMRGYSGPMATSRCAHHHAMIGFHLSLVSHARVAKIALSCTEELVRDRGMDSHGKLYGNFQPIRHLQP